MITKKLKILFVVNAYNSFQKDLIESIAPYCNQIYVCVRYRFGSSILKYIRFLNVKSFEGSNLIKLENLPSNVRVFKISVFFLPLALIRNLIYKKFYIGIVNILDKEKIEFDLIHSVFTDPSGKTAFLLSEKYKKPFIHTLYEDDNWLKEIIDNKLFNFKEFEDKVSFFTSNSQRKKFNFNISKFKVIYNGYNSKLYYQKSKEESKNYLKLDNSKKYIINISTVDSRKNQELLIRAFNNLSLKYPDYDLILIGDGPKMTYIKGLISTFKLHKRILIAGYQPHNILNEISH